MRQDYSLTCLPLHHRQVPQVPRKFCLPCPPVHGAALFSSSFASFHIRHSASLHVLPPAGLLLSAPHLVLCDYVLNPALQAVDLALALAGKAEDLFGFFIQLRHQLGDSLVLLGVNLAERFYPAAGAQQEGKEKKRRKSNPGAPGEAG